MNAAWVSAIVGVAMIAGVFAGALWRGGPPARKIDAVLQQLTSIVQDHEARLRIVERIRARR
jgi:hypothetical protein